MNKDEIIYKAHLAHFHFDFKYSFHLPKASEETLENDTQDFKIPFNSLSDSSITSTNILQLFPPILPYSQTLPSYFNALTPYYASF